MGRASRNFAGLLLGGQHTLLLWHCQSVSLAEGEQVPVPLVSTQLFPATCQGQMLHGQGTQSP